MQRTVFGLVVLVLAAAHLAACSGGGGSAGGSYTVSGTVAGLAGSGLVLSDNGTDDLGISADGGFTFTTAIANGGSYAVSVKSQPVNPSQTCTVNNGSGIIASANVAAVSVICSTNAYAVGGTVTGLAGSGLVLSDNGGDDLALSANGTFQFPTKLADGAAYAVTVKAQPANPSQTCTASSNNGTIAGADVTSLSVVCSTNAYAVGGTVTGLAGSGLVLQNNGADYYVVNAAGPFSFPAKVASGAGYAVTVKTQPAGQACTVSAGNGTVASGDVSSVSVSCTNNPAHTIGGTVTGLGGTGLVLQNNGGDDLPLSSNGTFTFVTGIPEGLPYAVTVATQPSGQLCSVSNGVGTVLWSSVTNVTITCSADSFTVGGSVSGLSGAGLVLQNNGADDLGLAVNGTFAFATPVAHGSPYSVTIKTQPAGQTCSVSNGSGVLGAANVTTVSVACSDIGYTVGGMVSGLTGTGLVLRNNGGDDKSVSANGSFTFATTLASGAAYSVTVKAQPSGQTCSVANGSGTIGAANVTNVVVSCGAAAGTLDAAFNSTGVAAHDNASGATLGTFADQGNGITIDGNGKILVTGFSSKTGANTDMVIWRYTSDGALDTTFNGTGFVVSNGTAGGNSADAGQAITVDGNGKILVTGYSTNAAGNYDMVIWRYDDNGTPDTTFNGTGYVVSNGAAGGNSYDAGWGMTIDGNGKIVVTGYSYNTNNNMDMVIWRYNADGTADTTFNGNGIVVQKAAAGATYGDDFGSSITTDGGGNILVTGYSTNASGNADMVLWRYTAGGTLDTTFNSTGIVVSSNVAGGAGFDSGNSIAIDAAGKIVVSGSSRNSGPNDDLVVWRYKTDGTLDTTFDSTGYVVMNGVAGANGNDSGNGIAIDGSGRIVVAGSSMNSSGNSDIVVLRFNGDGTLDTAFDGTGIAAINNAAGGNSQDYGARVAIDGSGKIVVTGASTNGSGNLDMVVVRLNP